jgi:hypothetical protein
MSTLQVLLFLRNIQGQSTRGRKTRVVAQHHISMGQGPRESLPPEVHADLRVWEAQNIDSPFQMHLPYASEESQTLPAWTQQSPTHPFSWVTRRKLRQAVMPALDNDACSSHLNPPIKSACFHSSRAMELWGGMGFPPQVTDICQMWMVVICHLTGTWVYTVLPRSTTEMHWASLMNPGPWSGTELEPHPHLALSELQWSVSIGTRVGIKHKSNGKSVKEKQITQ